MKAVLTVAFALSLAGCAAYPYGPPPPLPIPGGETAVATIPIGGRASLNGIRIVPLRVVEDSRCPAGVQCVWAGRLVIEALIGDRGQPDQVRQLTLGQPVPLAGGTLILFAANPPKTNGGPPASIFTFEWRGY